MNSGFSFSFRELQEFAVCMRKDYAEPVPVETGVHEATSTVVNSWQLMFPFPRWLLLLSFFFVWRLNGFAGVAARPNVVLITLDTTRADRMGFLGSQRGLTPNLDALARQSAVFTRAYSQVPLTTPSHATILTGTYPQFHQVKDFGVQLSEDLPYLPAILRAQRYHTAAFVAAIVLDPQARLAPGFERGFDLYDAGFSVFQPGLDRYQTAERRGEEVVAHALAWLNKSSAGPFFLWVHLYDPHDPYDPPEPFKSQYASAPYDGEIAYEDSAIGKLLDHLRARGLYDNSVIAVMSDHGEALGEHGEDTHGIFLYDETIHVPLVLKLPGQRNAGKKIADRVGLVDVLPTVLQAAGIEIPKDVQGESLVGMMTRPERPGNEAGNAAPAPDRPSYSETDYAHHSFGWSSLQALRSGKYLYIQAPRRELYDEQADPKEQNNRAPTSSATADTLASQLASFQRKTTSSNTGPKTLLDADQQEKLGALGYVGGGANSLTSADSEGADPKDKIAVANLIHKTKLLQEEQRYQEVVPLLEQVISQEPKAGLAYRQLGQCYMSLKEFPKAVAAFRKAVELSPESVATRSQLGVALFATGDFAAAVPLFEEVVASRPDWPEGHFSLATAYSRSDRIPQAITEYEKVIKIDPNSFPAYLFLGRILYLNGNAAGALPKLKKAVALNPNGPVPHSFLADAYDSLGRKLDAKRERAKAEQLTAKRKE